MTRGVTVRDVRAAWNHGRELLLKGAASSPGLPLAPSAPHKRAPRPRRAFFDPLEQVSHPSAPEVVQPITLGDLQDLKQQSSVELVPQRSTRVKSTIRPGGGSRVRASIVDDARRSAQLRVQQTTRNDTATRLHELGKRVARFQDRRPVQYAPQQFSPT